MRCLLIAAAVIVPICASAEDRKLDTSKRAQIDAGYVRLEVTATEFRNMQRRYRPTDFAECVKKLQLLHAGMTENKILEILKPKVTFPAISNDFYNDSIVLNDAYFAFASFDQKKRLVYLNGPFAVSYQIKAAEKKSPKT